MNLVKKDYHWFNEPLKKEEYEKRLSEMNLLTWNGLLAARKRAYEFWTRFPNKFMQGVRNEDVKGEYVTHSKNVKDGY